MPIDTSLTPGASLWEPLRSESDLFALLCQRKGWTDTFLETINNPAHDTLKDMDRMIAILEHVRLTGYAITIAPDFDMDGISSGVLGYAGLSELGFNVSLHVPDYKRGHDLTPADIDEIASLYPDTAVLLTCDGGVNSTAGIAAARGKGWITLVTDHHQELPPGSTADITINPCRIDEVYKLPGICGAHVLYQVLEAYTTAYQPTKTWAISLLKLFAGLGTVSDVMPLLFENRQLVRDSLSLARLLYVHAPRTIPNRWGDLDPDPQAVDPNQALLLKLVRVDDHHPVYLRALRGFAVMMKAFMLKGKLLGIDALDEGFYGFYLAPAMNSPRRTGAPLKDCFDVFTADSIDQQLAAAERIIANNELRKQLTIDYLTELNADDQPLAPWVYFSSAPGGMLGLLASAMMEANGHPVVVLHRPTDPTGPLSGSARAPLWFEMITALEQHPDLMGIGHQQACGVRVARPEALDDLVAVLSQATALALLDSTVTAGPVADLSFGIGPGFDASITDTDELIELIRRVETLRPFGHAFSAPVFELTLDPTSIKIERIGSDADCQHPGPDDDDQAEGEFNAKGYWVCFKCKKHLRLITANGMSCLWWNAADEHHAALLALRSLAADPSRPDDRPQLRFLVSLQLNEFRGLTRVQAVIDQLL